MRKWLLLFFISAFIFSCSGKNKVPKEILPPEKMEDVLWSMISAGEFLNMYVLNKDSIDKVAESAKMYGKVFQVHHITREQFDKSYAYYRGHPALMTTILDSLGKRVLPVDSSNLPKPGLPDSMRKRIIKPEVEVN